VVQVAEG